ncbi:MAG: hypothetical protein JXA13_13040 [Anaerolineales bacterium]|nr:hypothetical protein [Anaerolineales bacterium]
MADKKLAPNQLEESSQLQLDFKKLRKVGQAKEAVLPVAVQHAETGVVLLIGYVNQAALDYTIKNKIAAFWSTSRDELWIKGATSGDSLEVVEIRVNCEQNSLLYLVRTLGAGACHTKDKKGRTRMSCYYRRLRNSRLELVGS